MADIISVQGDQISPPSFRKQLTTPNLQPDPTFAFLPFLARTYGFGYAPKNDRPFCEAFRRGECPLGPSCPDQHVIPINERSGIGHLICKHYQRGLCKKGDACEFAHTFDLRSERECKEFSRFGICPQGDECECVVTITNCCHGIDWCSKQVHIFICLRHLILDFLHVYIMLEVSVH